jgi:anti-sigma B factor antagonist
MANRFPQVRKGRANVDARVEQGHRIGGLEMRSAPSGGSHLITLSGELDLNNCRAVESELLRVEAGGAEQIVVDLGGVDFIDSNGIAMLIAAVRRSKEDSDRLRLVPSRSEDVQRLIEICGLDGRLPFIE